MELGRKYIRRFLWILFSLKRIRQAVCFMLDSLFAQMNKQYLKLKFQEHDDPLNHNANTLSTFVWNQNKIVV